MGLMMRVTMNEPTILTVKAPSRDYRIGDTVSLSGVVTDLGENTIVVLVDSMRIAGCKIAVGDRVMGGGHGPGKVLALYGTEAWVAIDEVNAPRSIEVSRLERLRMDVT